MKRLWCLDYEPMKEKGTMTKMFFSQKIFDQCVFQFSKFTNFFFSQNHSTLFLFRCQCYKTFYFVADRHVSQTVLPLISIGSGLIFVGKDRVYPRGAGKVSLNALSTIISLGHKCLTWKTIQLISLEHWQQIKKVSPH